jgi:putative chitinase
VSLSVPRAFYDSLRAGLLGPTLSPQEVNGCMAVLDAMEGTPLAWAAYALATAYHETASTMLPIKEYGGETYFTRMYDVTGARSQMAVANGNTCAGDGPRYCGRGYVQLTWKNNYARAGRECGVDLVADPDLALNPEVAAKVLRRGMEEGWFTGKELNDYLPASGRATSGQYAYARYIINGSDKAQQIAAHAKQFEDALVLGGWQ